MLAWLALSPSCERASRPRGALLAECVFNDDCAAPLVCAARRCRAECRTDRDCTNNWRCLSAGEIGRYVCYAPDDLQSACVYSADCRASWVCADRECRPQCRYDYDCQLLRPGLTCVRALGVCSAHPNLTDAGTLRDVDLNDPDDALTPTTDVVAADVATTDGAATDGAGPDGAATDGATTDVPVDAGDPYACAVRHRAGACDPGVGCAVVSVGIGISVRCAALSDGSVRCWGSNGSGSLGTGDRVSCEVPGLVRDLSDADVVGVGGTYACARRRGGAGIQCWGQSYVGELGNGLAMGAFALAPTMNSAPDGELFVGNAHACTLGAGGAARCWGTNASGQFGDGTIGGMGIFNYWATPHGFSLAMRSVSLGVSHACGVGLDGAARCWGSNSDGALGDGSMTAHPAPTAVAGLAAVEQVVVGQVHGCARLGDGTVRCWGANASGQVGDGSRASRLTPVTPAVTGVAELAAASFATCARRTDGRVWCWGDGALVGLGAGATATPTPTEVPGLAGVTRLYGGAAGFCALRGVNADLVCWGRAAGNVTTSTAMAPVGVSW